MPFDPNNKIIQLCAKGMEMEGQQHSAEARALFMQAWEEATTDFEKFTAAHYVARHQSSSAEKLSWDEKALEFALKIDDPAIAASLPSLYLNIAKGYEDADNLELARENYQIAFSYEDKLPVGHYGEVIKAGIKNGMTRVADS